MAPKARSSAVPLEAAASRLGVSPGTVRRWIRAGAPQARRGRRGRGGQALLDPRAIAAWRARGAEPRTHDALRVFAAELLELVADAVWQVFTESAGPHKRVLAGELSAAWYAVSCALLDRLRVECPELAGVEVMPKKIVRLRSIYRDFGTLRAS